MWTAIKTFFGGTDGIRNLILVVVGGLLILAVFGSVAYASYSYARRNVDKEISAVQTAMTAQFNLERQNLIQTYQRSDQVAAELAALRGQLAKQNGQITGSLATLRKQYKDIYEVLIPEQGVQQWDAARNMYNAAARPSESPALH